MILKGFLIVFVFGFLTSCGFKDSKSPSYLIVAVDSLPFEKVPCGTAEIENLKGLRELCASSVRFTHAYTPSVLSQPALTSLLTGLYPFQSEVRDNGSNFLKPEIKTVAEHALEKGYRTGFFSGGPPIFTKSGLHQGFEVFNDYIDVKQNQAFRPIKETAKSFERWYGSHSKGESFFSVLYLTDLNFPNETTEDEFGEIRNRSYSSQIQEVDEVIGKLIKKFKNNNQWHKINFVLVGLNGLSSGGRKGLKPINLHSENSQVVFMVKPSSIKRDQGINWKIDKNVTLVDLGYTLKKEFASSLESHPVEYNLPLVSLSESFYNINREIEEYRPILIESGWANWLGVSNIKYALKIGQYLFMYNKQIDVYNSLTDSREKTKINSKEQFILPFVNRARDIQKEYVISQWRPLPEDFVGKIQIAHDLWMSKRINKDAFIRLSHISKSRFWDPQIIQWLAGELVKAENWKDLEQIATRYNKVDWLYVAQSNLGKSPQRRGIKGCASFFLSFKKDRLKFCNDPVFKSYLLWKNESKNKSKRWIRFSKEYMNNKFSDHVAKLNYANYMTWSVNSYRHMGPQNLDLYLSLPEKQKERDYLEKQLSLIAQ